LAGAGVQGEGESKAENSINEQANHGFEASRRAGHRRRVKQEAKLLEKDTNHNDILRSLFLNAVGQAATKRQIESWEKIFAALPARMMLR
jgi:hypothetical protein